MNPHKWGIKVWVRCGVSGILYDFDVYLGKLPDTDTCKKYGKVGAVVLKLVEILPKNVGHKVYMDNLFSSINLIIWNNKIYGQLEPIGIIDCMMQTG